MQEVRENNEVVCTCSEHYATSFSLFQFGKLAISMSISFSKGIYV